MDDTVRVWLVERSYTDKGLVTLVYATPDGSRQLRTQLSSNALARRAVTAGKDVESERLTPVGEADRRERYAEEASRVAQTHDPETEI